MIQALLVISKNKVICVAIWLLLLPHQARSQGGFSRCGRTPLSNKRSTISPKRSTILFEKPQICQKGPLFCLKYHKFFKKGPVFCLKNHKFLEKVHNFAKRSSSYLVEKVHNFVQKNHPVKVSGYGPAHYITNCPSRACRCTISMKSSSIVDKFAYQCTTPYFYILLLTYLSKQQQNYNISRQH